MAVGLYQRFCLGRRHAAMTAIPMIGAFAVLTLIFSVGRWQHRDVRQQPRQLFGIQQAQQRQLGRAAGGLICGSKRRRRNEISAIFCAESRRFDIAIDPVPPRFGNDRIQTECTQQRLEARDVLRCRPRRPAHSD